MAYIRRIIFEPDPILHKVAKKVTNLELKLPLTQQLIDDMFVTMHNAPGIGLAAPQVGIGKRIIVVQLGGEDDPAYAVVNPVLSDFEGEEEGRRRLPLHPRRDRRRQTRGRVHGDRTRERRQEIHVARRGHARALFPA